MHSLLDMPLSLYASLERSINDFGAMYDHVRVPPAREGLARNSHSDVTSSTQGTTPPTQTTSELLLEDVLDDPEYDQISDRAEVEEEEACWRRDPLALRRRAMAEDFSEGKLETVVDSPQKENAGTQTQYVSYQVTTKVGRRTCSCVEPL